MKFFRDLLSTQTGSAFRRNFVLVLRANVLAQLIAVVSMPLLSRLYTSSDFGLFAVFASVAALAIAVSTGRFDWLIPNSRNALSAGALIVLGLCVTVIISVVSLVIGLFAVLMKIRILEESGLGSAILLLPVVLIGAGFIEMLNGWFVRTNDLRAVSRSRIAQSSINSGMGLLAGILGFGAIGLICAFIASRWAGVTTLARNAGRLWSLLPRLTVRRIKMTFVRYRRQAGWATLVSIVNAVSLSGTIFILAAFFSLREVGWYTLMQRLAAGPVSLITASLGQSFWAAAAEKARAGQFVELQQLHFRTTQRLALLAIPILLGCSLGPLVVGPLFGKAEWGEAGFVLLAMAPLLVGSAIFSPTNHLVVYNRQAYQLFSDVFSIVLSFIAILVCARLKLSFAISIFAMSVAVLIAYVLRFFLHVKANREATRVSRPA